MNLKMPFIQYGSIMILKSICYKYFFKWYNEFTFAVEVGVYEIGFVDMLIFDYQKIKINQSGKKKK